MPTHFVRRLATLLCAATVLAGPLAGSARSAPPDHSDHVQAFASDVFEVIGTALVRASDSTRPDAQLSNVVGFQLPFTWAQWTSASATSRAATLGGPAGRRTDFRVSLQGLVPAGVYSLFYATTGPDSSNPHCPNVDRLVPLPAARPDAQFPDPSSFVADAAGGAEFHGRVDHDVLAATQAFLMVIYHADGQTYHPLPNRGAYLTQGEHCRSSFGHDAMRQLIVYQKW